MSRNVVSISRIALAALVALLLASCASAPKQAALERQGLGLKQQAADGGTAGDAMRLQSSLMALSDTAAARITNELRTGVVSPDPLTRRYHLATRVTLVSALWSIATGPDPVDGLLDIVTHTTLTADAQRSLSKGKPADSPDAKLQLALDRNEADAWKLAEQWFDEPTRRSLRERILAAPVERDSPATVAYVRLSDLPRAGSATVAGGDGVIDQLRAANAQADQVRLLAERSLFLMQRMPYLMRWQADSYASDTMQMPETQVLLKQMEELAKASTAASKTVAQLPATLSRERAAALDDLFGHIATERRAAIDQLTEAIRAERAATLADISATIAKERKATIDDVSGVMGMAEQRGSTWIGTALVVGIVLIALFLGGLFGTIVLYRRYAFRLDQREVRKPS